MKHIELEDFKTLKSHLRDHTTAVNLCIETIMRLGLRGVEVWNLCLTDFDFVNNVVTVRGAKGGSRIDIGISKDFAQRLVHYIGDFEEGHGVVPRFDPLFPKLMESKGNQASFLWLLRRDFKRLLFKLFQQKYSNIALHSLRHSFALLLLSKGLNLGELRHSLRHKDLKSTLVYADFALKVDLKSKIKRAIGE